MTLAALASRTARLAFIPLCAGFALQSLQAIAQDNGSDNPPPVVLHVEEPKSGMIYQGVANLRGWAVGLEGIDRIEAYLDGQYLSTVPFGGARTDVGDAFPDYQGAEESGFAMTLNYGDYSRGGHTLTVRAVGNSGEPGERDFVERTLEFETTRFPSNYIHNEPDSSAIRVDDAHFNIDIDDGFCIQDMIVGVTDEEAEDTTFIPHDVCLRWRNETQGFAIETIYP